MHFERGRDYARAVRYLEQAGQRAVQRSANREAENHFSTALKFLKMLPDASKRMGEELVLQNWCTVLRANKV